MSRSSMSNMSNVSVSNRSNNQSNQSNKSNQQSNNSEDLSIDPDMDDFDSKIEDSIMDDNDEEKAISQMNISKEFQENVIKYVKMDDLVRRKEKEIKELKAQRKPCEDFILSYLEQVGENVIEITNGKLRRNKSETKVALNQDIIKKAIATKIQDPKQIQEVMMTMETLRPLNTRVNLKRTRTGIVRKPDKKKG